VTPTPLPTHNIPPTWSKSVIEIDSGESDMLIQYLQQKDMTTFWFFGLICSLLLIQIIMRAFEHHKQD